MVNKATVGRAGPRFELSVERGKIREFARATGSSSPEYLDAANPVVPPTFLATVVFWQPPEAAAHLTFYGLIEGCPELEKVRHSFIGPQKPSAALPSQALDGRL